MAAEFQHSYTMAVCGRMHWFGNMDGSPLALWSGDRGRGLAHNPGSPGRVRIACVDRFSGCEIGVFHENSCLEKGYELVVYCRAKTELYFVITR